MARKADVIRNWEDMSWSNPPSSAVEATKKYYSDDFKSLDADGNVVGNKDAMVAMTRLLFQAFKDFKGVVHDISEEGDHVIMTFHFEGTHTGDLDLSAMGMGVIPATGKRVVTPEGKTKFMVAGGQITASQPISGGFEDLLAGIGALPPA